MWRCPVCEKEQIHGFVCDDCGFDGSRDYERNRTLSPTLPDDAKTISGHRLEWKRRQMGTPAFGAFACPKCGKKYFLISTDAPECVCMGCDARVPFEEMYHGLKVAPDLLNEAEEQDGEEYENGEAPFWESYYERSPKGIIIDKYPVETFYYYYKAAKAGDADAQCNLGWCLMTGFGTRKNAKEAAYWFRKSADAGVPAAQYNLGRCYLHGSGVEKSQNLAEVWFQQAAKANHPMAQYCLGLCYEHGNASILGRPVSLDWYAKAVDNGVLPPKYVFERCLQKQGKEVDELYDLFKRAADLGRPISEFVPSESGPFRPEW